MNSSSYYAAKILEFKNIKSQLAIALTEVTSCGEVAVDCSKYTSEMIVGNETFDKGNLLKFSASLISIAADLNVISAECDIKIIKYQVLYEIALKLERMKEQFDL